MGGTLITPINGMGFAQNHERKQSWASLPLQTLRGPETVRGTMIQLERPSMVKPRNQRTSRPRLGVVWEDAVQPSPGIALLRDIEKDMRPAAAGDSISVFDMTAVINEATEAKIKKSEASHNFEMF